MTVNPESVGPTRDPSAPATGELTELLRRAQDGDDTAQEEAARLVYRELHSLAAVYLNRERGDHTLQPTALVHEAFLRLLGQSAPWKNRSHFFGIAAQMMRRILVDYARRVSSERRERTRVLSLDYAAEVPVDAAQDVLGVHEALERLERMDPRQARVVELKFFVGLSLDEIAEVMDISPATVSREWAMARVWLQRQLEES